jgi:hypothetical protein
LERRNIRSGTEGAPCPGDNDGAYRRIEFDDIKGANDREEHFRTHGVQLFRPVERQQRNPIRTVKTSFIAHLQAVSSSAARLGKSTQNVYSLVGIHARPP